MKNLRLKGVLSFIVLAGAILTGVPVASAAGQSCVWTGAAGNTKFSGVANWSDCGGGVPTAGDTIVFKQPTQGKVSLTNDLQGVVLGGIVASGSATEAGAYEIDTAYSTTPIDSGKSAVTVTVASFNLVPAKQSSVSTQAVVRNGSNILVESGTQFEAFGLGGSLSEYDGSQYISLNGKTITIENGATLAICAKPDTITTTTANIVMGGGTGAAPKITISPCMGAVGAPAIPAGGVRFNGTFSLASSASVNLSNNNVSFGNPASLNGNRLTLSAAGASKVAGTGTYDVLQVSSDSHLAPGNSPGCITAATLQMNGVYNFEVGGKTACSEHDQIVISGTVADSLVIDSATALLDVSQYNGFVPKAGDSFVIISQAGTQAVNGHFKDLAEGAVFTTQGVTYKISYAGGDGNDVTLTVQNIPAVPNTGVMIIKSNPTMIAGVAVVAALLLVGAARFASRRS